MKILQLSQEIGVGIDTLRIWERRYGFPVPGRDARGHRSYNRSQVEELRVVKNSRISASARARFSLSVHRTAANCWTG